ncbi:hypothetical protein Peur_015336 [Populus x canadensis]
MPRSSLDQSKHAERNLLGWCITNYDIRCSSQPTDQEFEAKTVDVNEYDDVFFESPGLREDLKVLYKRSVYLYSLHQDSSYYNTSFCTNIDACNNNFR